jgi:hypothetical protein
VAGTINTTAAAEVEVEAEAEAAVAVNPKKKKKKNQKKAAPVSPHERQPKPKYCHQFGQEHQFYQSLIMTGTTTPMLSFGMKTSILIYQIQKHQSLVSVKPYCRTTAGHGQILLPAQSVLTDSGNSLPGPSAK